MALFKKKGCPQFCCVLPPFLCKENYILMVKSSIFKHSHILKRHWYSRNRLSAVTLSRTYATARLWLFWGFPNLPRYQRVGSGRADPSGNPKNIQKHALPAALPPLLESESQKKSKSPQIYLVQPQSTAGLALLRDLQNPIQKKLLRHSAKSFIRMFLWLNEPETPHVLHVWLIFHGFLVAFP